MRYLLVVLFLFGCGSRPSSTSPSPSARTQLMVAYNDRLAVFKTATAAHLAGWPSDTNCDGALWAGAARRAGADWVDIAQALQDDGRPTRRPSADCAEDESAATTSPDMMLGIILGLEAAKDVTSLEQMFQYGLSHTWIMGSPAYRIDRVLLRPNGISLLARTIAFLSAGASIHEERAIPIVYTPGVEDFAVHLLFLSTLVHHDLGDDSVVHEAVVQAVCRANATDALGQAVCGNGPGAAGLLLGDYVYPGYVRDSEFYLDVHWLLAAKVALEIGV